jgi:ABC-2 type transport system ATP-binding protein
METVVDQRLTVVLSSHLLADVERACDHLIVLAAGEVVLAGDVEELLAAHRVLSGPPRDPRRLPADQQVIQASHTDRQTTLLVRTTRPILDPAWTVSDVGLEELVLAYMSRSNPPPQPGGPGAVLHHTAETRP